MWAADFGAYLPPVCLIIVWIIRPVSPDDTCGISTLSRNAEALRALYEKGYQAGEKLLLF